MSFSRSGPEPVANKVGKLEFGKWILYQTSEKEDRWRKNLLDREYGHPISDNYIMIVRSNIDTQKNIYSYSLMFTGESRWLQEHFDAILGTEPKFNDIQNAKDQVDRVLSKINNLIAFT